MAQKRDAPLGGQWVRKYDGTIPEEIRPRFSKGAIALTVGESVA